MEHHFNVEVAKVYGVEEAILIHNIFFWIKKNVANDRHNHDGRYWTYNSSKAFAELFPYFNEKKIYRLLADMCQKKILIKGNFNKNAFDRTMWYALSDETLSVLDKEKYDISQMSESYDEKCTFHFSKMENGFSESGEPIPYSNTDSKQDNKEEIDKSIPKKDGYLPLAAEPQQEYGKVEEKGWRDSFEVYLGLVNTAKERLLNDTEYRQYMEKYYPNIDYDSTLNKLVDGFWGKKEGWEYCKSKRKGKTINMTSALKKNMDRRDKIIYKQKHDVNTKKYVSSQSTKVPLHPDLRIIDSEGNLNDGTFTKNGYRYYYSKIANGAVSIPTMEEPKPFGRNFEYDMKLGWYECE